MIQSSFQPIFHLFNSILPSISAFMVVSAVLSSLPNLTGQRTKGQVNQTGFNRMKLQWAKANRVKQGSAASHNVLPYTIPTSMRTRTSRKY